MIVGVDQADLWLDYLFEISITTHLNLSITHRRLNELRNNYRKTDTQP